MGCRQSFCWLKAAGALVLIWGLICCLAWGLLLVSPAAARAQEPPIVSARVVHSRDAYPQGGTYPLALELAIAPKFHINSDRPAEPDLFPSKLSWTLAPGLTLAPAIFPPAQKYQPAFAKQPLLVLSGRVLVKTTLQVAGDVAAGSQRLSAHLTYQACDDQSCLMPAELEIPIMVQVVPAGADSKQINQEIFRK